jgi:hypothetical protein
MVAGGTEASINEISVCGFLRAQALSTKVGGSTKRREFGTIVAVNDIGDRSVACSLMTVRKRRHVRLIRSATASSWAKARVSSFLRSALS